MAFGGHYDISVAFVKQIFGLGTEHLGMCDCFRPNGAVVIQPRATRSGALGSKSSNDNAL